MYSTITFAAFIALTRALYAPKGSACAVECGTKAQNFTGTSDLVCLDTAYEDDSKGVLLKGCISCLSNSTYVNTTVTYHGNTDQYWYLWHIKYVQQYCLVDTPQTTAAKNCDAYCSPMKDALDVSWIYNKAGVQRQYGYCDWNSSQYMTYGQECASCLQNEKGGVVIGNFADTTYNACQSQPHIKDGELVTTSRDLFNSVRIDAEASTPVTSATASGGTSSSTGAASATTTGSGETAAPATSTEDSSGASSADSPATGLSSGAAAGIGVGATLAVLAAAVGLFFLLRRRKQTVAQERLSTPPAYGHELGPQKPLHEISGKEKHWPTVSELDVKNVPLQELDGSHR